jgi:hypothetical protein
MTPDTDMEPEDILWTINVFSRVDQLKQQEEMIRRTYGDRVKIMVFCNNPAVDPRYREDFLVRTSVNSGHHTGVRDAHNAVLPFLRDYDVVFSSHADCFFIDWRTPVEILARMRSEQKLMAQFGSLENWNTHRNQVQPYVFNDFFAMDARAWERMGEITDYCDGDEGIECTLARWIRKAIAAEDILSVPCVDVRGYGTPPPHMFRDVFGIEGNHMLRENDAGAKVAYLREKQPDVVEILEKAGLA